YLKNHYSSFLDTSKIALMGYSAGGHLALLYSYSRWNTSGCIPVTLVISAAGPTDINQIWEETPANSRTLLERLMGNQSTTDISPFYVSKPSSVHTV
ncbi:MAG: hypothetical protein J6Z23_01305, partial [Lachnospiraceae bacterium]|nr:hypothetical protein [Lachnospiraceae bacterium]